MATCAQKYVTQQSSILQLSRQHCISPAFPVMKYMLSTLERYQTLHEQRRHPLSSRSDKSSFILQQPGVREGLTVKGNHVVSSSARGLTEGHSTVQLVSGKTLNAVSHRHAIDCIQSSVTRDKGASADSITKRPPNVQVLSQCQVCSCTQSLDPACSLYVSQTLATWLGFCNSHRSTGPLSDTIPYCCIHTRLSCQCQECVCLVAQARS